MTEIKKQVCPACGAIGAYVGFIKIECPNINCKHYKLEQDMENRPGIKERHEKKALHVSSQKHYGVATFPAHQIIPPIKPYGPGPFIPVIFTTKDPGPAVPVQQTKLTDEEFQKLFDEAFKNDLRAIKPTDKP